MKVQWQVTARRVTEEVTASYTPPLPENAQAAAKGAERFEGFMQRLGKRLASSDRFLKELSRDIEPSSQTAADVDEGDCE